MYVWFSLQSEYTPGSVSYMKAIHHLSYQKKSWKPRLEATLYTPVWLTLFHTWMASESISSPIILSLDLQAYIKPPATHWASLCGCSSRLPKHIIAETELASNLFPQPNCSFSAVHFYWLHHHSPSLFTNLRIIFNVSQVSSQIYLPLKCLWKYFPPFSLPSP